MTETEITLRAAARDVRKGYNEGSCIAAIAEGLADLLAIATEAATAAETVQLGSVHEGAARRDRPDTPSLQTPQGGDS